MKLLVTGGAGFTPQHLLNSKFDFRITYFLNNLNLIYNLYE